MRAFEHNQIADVRLVQRILVAKGFDTGGIDGLVGPRTKAAITAFQRAQQGAPSAGAIDATFLGALLGRTLTLARLRIGTRWVRLSEPE